MNDLEQLATLALSCARGAADILREGRRSGFGPVDTKSSAVDIVTELDRRSEQYIVERIRSSRAQDAIVGEEGTDVAGQTSVRWVIDPLDGTVNFTYDIPAYAVCIGVEIDGVPTIGAVINPATDEEFFAVKGGGATLNGAATAPRIEQDLSRALIATGFSYQSDERAAAAKKLALILPAVRDLRRAGSAALDLCAVACGRLDGYYELQVNPWDVSAAYVVATEAGVKVTGIDQSIPRQNVVAANPTLYQSLLDLVSTA